MNANDIEPGMILLGHHGQVRDVVAVDGKSCWYVQHGAVDQTPVRIYCHGMARWTVRDITELPAGMAA